MSFLRTACAVRADRERLCRVAFAVAMISLAILFVSCGSGKLPAFTSGQTAYVTLPTSNSVLMLHINGLTGVVTTGSQTPQVSGTAPHGLALLPHKFLYVANSQANTISVYAIASDGSLNLSATPTPVGGTGPDNAVLDSSGQYLFVTNSFSANISVFSINSSSGALTPVTGSPFYANDSPGEILIPPGTNFVYVTNSRIGTVSAFTFSSSTGVLTPMPGSPFVSGPGASGLTVSNNGLYLYVANSTALNPGSNTVGNISGFSIDTTTGSLTRLANSPFTSPVGSGPSTLIGDPSGRFIFATTPGTAYSIWCFTIDPTTGQLTATPGSPFSVASGGLFVLTDNIGSFLYIGSQSASGIEAYTYNSNTGQPSTVLNSPFSTFTPPGKMVIAQ
jgi:6-phosphogluconolactonase